MNKQENTDVLVIGAGAAGLMCALSAGRRGRRVIVLDHASRPGKKILASGGGKCNFSNYSIEAKHYLSGNPHFCKSAISRFGVYDFLDLLYQHEITFEERAHGQLFCVGSAAEIVNMLLSECRSVGVAFQMNSTARIERCDAGFRVRTAQAVYTAESLVIATGGVSHAQIGATDFGYQVAAQFGLDIVPPRPGLAPLQYRKSERDRLQALSGIALNARLECGKRIFGDALLFTHRGISGPAVLQISNYWQPGQSVEINLLPEIDLYAEFLDAKAENPRKEIKKLLGQYLPKRLVAAFLSSHRDIDRPIGEWKNLDLDGIAGQFNRWQFTPAGAGDFEKAEVTLGGVDVHGISSKNFEVSAVKGLYFIGEVLDVTGWLGGYNLHWAWASGWCAGQSV